MNNTVINRKATEKIGRALGELNDRVIFVGGAMLSLYIDDPAAEERIPGPLMISKILYTC